MNRWMEAAEDVLRVIMVDEMVGAEQARRVAKAMNSLSGFFNSYTMFEAQCLNF